MAKEKERLDVLLVNRGLASSREKARANIMAGMVVVNGRRLDKPGTFVDPKAEIKIVGTALPYVSRGGLKLAKALAVFNIDLTGKVVVDIGASTGGFTDCALKHGAAKVFAIDVGYGQLAWSLRNDPRVVLLERTNIRYVTLADLDEAADVITIDVSFISLQKVLPVAAALLKPQGQIIALIKPQFEAGREKVGKKGVVRDPQVHLAVICEVIDAARAQALVPAGLTFSPIRGSEGNIEYLLWLCHGYNNTELALTAVDAVVAQAHASL